MTKIIYRHSTKFQEPRTITVYEYEYKNKDYSDKYGTMICPICNSEVKVSTFESHHLKTKKCRKASE